LVSHPGDWSCVLIVITVDHNDYNMASLIQLAYDIQGMSAG
jgi:hypothetical protein